jgi:hypothetical protein
MSFSKTAFLNLFKKQELNEIQFAGESIGIYIIT